MSKKTLSIRIVLCIRIRFGMVSEAVADLGGHEGHTPPPPPGRPNSFDFMQFSGKFGKIVCWRPPWGVGTPTWGNPGSAAEKVSLDHTYSVEVLKSMVSEHSYYDVYTDSESMCLKLNKERWSNLSVWVCVLCFVSIVSHGYTSFKM